MIPDSTQGGMNCFKDDKGILPTEIRKVSLFKQIIVHLPESLAFFFRVTVYSELCSTKPTLAVTFSLNSFLFCIGLPSHKRTLFWWECEISSVSSCMWTSGSFLNMGPHCWRGGPMGCGVALLCSAASLNSLLPDQNMNKPCYTLPLSKMTPQPPSLTP